MGHDLEGSLGEEVVLNARWSVARTTGGDRAFHVNQTLLREPVGSQNYSALVAAKSKMIAALSREIADAIESLANR